MMSSRTWRYVSTTTSSAPVALRTALGVAATRYPTPPTSRTRPSGVEATGFPRKREITSTRQLQERRRERVADRDCERIGSVVRCRQLLQRENRLHHALDLRLLRASVAAHRLLHARGRVLRARNARDGGRDENGAARLSDGERGAGVDADERLLERDRIGRVLGDESRHAVEDRLQSKLRPFAGGSRPPTVRDGLEAPSAFVDDPVPARSRSWVDADDLHEDTL